MKQTLLYLFLLFVPFNLASQIKQSVLFVETGLKTGLGKQTPFWQFSNSNGLETLNKNSSYIRASVQKEISEKNTFDFSYGLDLYNRFDGKNKFYFHQAYVAAKAWCFKIQAGKVIERFGDQDSLLSSGNLLWSGNAEPIPQVSISIPEYYPVIKGFVDVKGYLSHGWVNDNVFVKDYYLHHKNFYIRLGNKFPVTVSYGLEHYVQWGGTSPVAGKLPSGFKAYYDVFLAKVGNGDATTVNDSLNRIGNHIGSKNFTVEIKTRPAYLKFYWQYMFEDASYRNWENISDGLWGLSIQFHKGTFVKRIVYEFVRTVNQSGPSHIWNDTIQVGGKDNYFNNLDYRQGWSYYNRTIGTPFITSPIYNNNDIRFLNNRVIAQHIGISGILPKEVDYSIMLSYLQNTGTSYSIYPIKRNVSSVIDLTKIFCQTHEIKITVAFDLGKMYSQNLGFLIAYRKYFN